MAVNKSKTGEKKVRITLSYIPGEPEDKYVCLNGRDFMIKRGESVEVPESVAEIIKLSEDQNIIAERAIRKLVSESDI